MPYQTSLAVSISPKICLAPTPAEYFSLAFTCTGTDRVTTSKKQINVKGKKGNQGRVFAILLLSSPLFRDLPFPLYASSSSEMLHLLPSKALAPPDLIVRHLAGTQSTSLHRRRWRRLLGPRRRRWWWRLLPRRPVTVRVLRPAGRAPVTITVPVARVAHLAVCIFEHIRAVAAVFRLRGAQVEAHVGDLRRVCWHAAQRTHVGRCAGAVAERGWALEA